MNYTDRCYRCIQCLWLPVLWLLGNLLLQRKLVHKSWLIQKYAHRLKFIQKKTQKIKRLQLLSVFFVVYYNSAIRLFQTWILQETQAVKIKFEIDKLGFSRIKCRSTGVKNALLWLGHALVKLGLGQTRGLKQPKNISKSVWKCLEFNLKPRPFTLLIS